MIMNDPVNIMVTHIGKCHIIPLKKRKTGIIIFKIEGFPHTRRHLVNETKNALIAAGTVFIHETVLKYDPQVLLVILFNLQLPFLSICFSYKNLYILIIHQIVVVKDILDLLSIDRQKLIPCSQLQLLGNTPGFHFPDDMSAFFHNFSSFLNGSFYARYLLSYQ